MARVALIFLFAFCVFQISTASPVEEDKQSPSEIEKAFQGIGDFLKTTVTKEKLEELQNQVKALGDKFSEHGNNLMVEINKQISDLQKKEQAPQ